MTSKKLNHPAAPEAETPASENLIGEFKSLMADAEALLHATEGQHEGTIGAIRAKALETLAGAKETLSHAEGQFA